MNNQRVIVVLDFKKHGRDWPSKFENIEVKRVHHTDNLAIYENKVLLYAFHLRDFDAFSDDKLGIFSTDESNWPLNLLWYSGDGIDNDLPGHVYKCKVPHDIGMDNKFFDAIRRLAREILKKGFKNNNTKELSNEIWNVLYKQKIFLTALSILCQGYLIEQGEIILPDGITILKEKKRDTKRFNWWESALNDNTGIDEELETITKKGKVIPLIDIIKNKKPEYFYGDTLIQVKEVEFTKKVKEAYENLSEILEGNR